jgi:hypothetical protein
LAPRQAIQLHFLTRSRIFSILTPPSNHSAWLFGRFRFSFIEHLAFSIPTLSRVSVSFKPHHISVSAILVKSQLGAQVKNAMLTRSVLTALIFTVGAIC